MPFLFYITFIYICRSISRYCVTDILSISISVSHHVSYCSFIICFDVWEDKCLPNIVLFQIFEYCLFQLNLKIGLYKVAFDNPYQILIRIALSLQNSLGIPSPLYYLAHKPFLLPFFPTITSVIKERQNSGI